MKTLNAIGLILLLLQIPIGTGSATELGYPNRYSAIAESLFDMMDAFASAFQKKKNEYSRPSPLYQNPMYGLGYNPGFYPPVAPSPYGQFPGAPGGAPYGQGAWYGRLDGEWESHSGEILVIRHNRFRIFRDRDSFHDGLLDIRNEHLLIIGDALSGNRIPYEYAEQDGRLALRDQWGNLLLFVRLGF